MWKDAIVDEVRKAREEYAAKLDFDLNAIYLDLKEKEKLSDREIVSLSPKQPVSLTSK